MCFGAHFLYAAEKRADSSPSNSHLVLVTIAPHQSLVKRIAGDTVDVQILVPSTANVHTFEPVPRQMMTAAGADLWFRIGESFEPRLAKTLTSHNPNLRVIDLRPGLNLIYESQCLHCSHHEDGADLHYWLSPTELKRQAETVTKALSARYPEHAAQYRAALAQHLKELDALDSELRSTLAPLVKRSILVVHPAYGYFSRDYQLEQISVETEGKDPTPQKLTGLLQRAKQLGIKTVYTQVQYSPKVAEIVRQQLGPGAQVVNLDPYAADYMQNMRHLAKQFSKS